MKLRLSLIAAAAAALYCTAPMAQTYSPNPNKAQNSDMVTQGTTVYRSDLAPGTYYYYPSTPMSSEVYVAPSTSSVYVAPVSPSVSEVYVYPSEPLAGRRSIYVPSGPTDLNNTPNPNKFQNNGVPTMGSDATTIWYVEPRIIGY